MSNQRWTIQNLCQLEIRRSRFASATNLCAFKKNKLDKFEKSLMWWAIDEKQPYEVSFAGDDEVVTMSLKCSLSFYSAKEQLSFSKWHLFEPTKPTRSVCFSSERQVFLQVTVNTISDEPICLDFPYHFTVFFVGFDTLRIMSKSEFHRLFSNGIWHLQVASLSLLVALFALLLFFL